MSMIPTNEEIEKKARELAEQDGSNWSAAEAEEGSDPGIATKQYWLRKAEEVLKAERRNAL